ncbi:MAG: hypothetical protein ACYC3S_11960 [Chloroflexota bacterium]
MGSQVGKFWSGDPLFLAGAPGISHIFPAALWWLLRGKPRSLAEDAALVVCLLDPQPRMEGLEHIPASEPFVLVGNHYQPPGIWIGWVAAAITAAVAQARCEGGRELHWLAIAEWRWFQIAGRWVPNPVTSLIFPRASQIWGLVPTSARPTDIAGRARALREIMGYLGRRSRGGRVGSAEPVAIFPEGRATVALEDAMPGTGAFLQRLSGRGVPLLPVGIHHEERTIVIRFGEPFLVGQPPAETVDVDTWARERVMATIGRLIPASLWGYYAEVIKNPQGLSRR